MKIKKCLLAIAVTLPLLAGVWGFDVEAHTHAYSHMGPYVINSSPGTEHPYVKGTVTDENGNVTFLYETCQTEHQMWREYYMCACGDVINATTYPVEVHHGCGQ